MSAPELPSAPQSIADHPRLAPFHYVETPFWELRSTTLSASICIPKNITAGSTPPVIINFHGGGLVSGSRDLIDWWPQWMLDHAVARNAVIVVPDYPLTPEAQSPDIIAGVKAFLTWILEDGGLQKALDANETAAKLSLTADTGKVLVVGESAGGWVGLWSAVLRPESIRGLVMRFPMIDLDDAWYTTSHKNDKVSGIAAMLQQIPEELIDQFIATIQPGDVRTRGAPPPGFLVAEAAMAHGRVPSMIGTEFEESYPLRALEKGSDGKLPSKVWILHGEDDFVVPLAGSQKVRDVIAQKYPATEVKLDTASGDHGFDGAMGADESGFPIKERLQWLDSTWLS